MVIHLDHCEIDKSSDSSLQLGVCKILEAVRPDWKKEELHFKTYTEGLTNKLIGVWRDDFNMQILVRIYGEKTELFIDREAEKETMELLHKHGYGPELYTTFKNGLSYSFISGTPLSVDSMREERIWTAVGKQMATLHNIKVKKGEAFLFPKLSQFLDLLSTSCLEKHKDRLDPVGINKPFLEKETADLRTALTSLNCPVVLSHNDLLMNNIIWNEDTQEVHFIDYEYGALNYQPFDIGNHFCEFIGDVLEETDYEKMYPDANYQRRWIQNYLSCYFDKPRYQISPEEVEKWRGWANKFALAGLLMWGTWGLMQASNSSIEFDFIQYSVLRFQEYKKKKEEYLVL